MGDDEPNSTTNGLSGIVVDGVVVVSPTGIVGFCSALSSSWGISFQGFGNAARPEVWEFQKLKPQTN